MDFSIPYLKSGLALVVHKNQKQIMSLEDAKKFNARIGAQLGTTSYYFLEKESSIKTQGYQMYGHAITDLINGKLDAVLGESSGTLFYKNTPLFQQIKMFLNFLLLLQEQLRRPLQYLELEGYLNFFER